MRFTRYAFFVDFLVGICLYDLPEPAFHGGFFNACQRLC